MMVLVKALRQPQGILSWIFIGFEPDILHLLKNEFFF